MKYLRAYKAPALCLRIFTTVESALQIRPFMQNKANLLDAQMNLTFLITVDYENIANWKLGENKANTKPIKANLLDAQMNVSSFITKEYKNKSNWKLGENKPNTNPIKANPPAQYAIRDTRYKPNRSQFPPTQTQTSTGLRKSVARTRIKC
jgi:hypothetical protein